MQRRPRRTASATYSMIRSRDTERDNIFFSYFTSSDALLTPQEQSSVNCMRRACRFYAVTFTCKVFGRHHGNQATDIYHFCSVSNRLFHNDQANSFIEGSFCTLELSALCSRHRLFYSFFLSLSLTLLLFLPPRGTPLFRNTLRVFCLVHRSTQHLLLLAAGKCHHR